MKTTHTIPATIIALSLALAGAARADTGGPADAISGRPVAAAYVGSDAVRVAGNSGAPAGSIAALAVGDTGYQFTTQVATHDSAPAGSIALLANSGVQVAARYSYTNAGDVDPGYANASSDTSTAPAGSIARLSNSGAGVAALYGIHVASADARGDAGQLRAETPAATVASSTGLSRADVKAQVASELRAGDLPAPGDRGEETLAQKFPWKYAGSNVKTAAGMVSGSAAE